MVILATIAFGSRVTLDSVVFAGIEGLRAEHLRAARQLDMVGLVGSATLVDGKVDVRVQPSLIDCHHPLAAIEGAFNAVMLQGDAIREIMLAGPGAGGIETAPPASSHASPICSPPKAFLLRDSHRIC